MSMSVSDLAPFVATVLEDRVINNLHEEFQSLLADNRRLRVEGPIWTLAITGPGGDPVYATGTVLHRELLRKSGIDDGSDGVRENGGTVAVVFENGATACRRDSLRGCRLTLTPEAGVGRERAYSFDDELHDASEVWMSTDSGSPGTGMECLVELADLGHLILEVPILTGNFGNGNSYTLGEVEANMDPDAPIRFVGLEVYPCALTGRVRRSV